MDTLNNVTFYVYSSMRDKLVDAAHTIRSCLPILALGLARFSSVYFFEHSVHDVEYGVYWNFFLTLAVVRVSNRQNRPFCISTNVSNICRIFVVFQNYTNTSARHVGSSRRLVTLACHVQLHVSN